MSRSGQPSWPSASTCCFLSSPKMLVILAGTAASPPRQRPGTRLPPWLVFRCPRLADFGCPPRFWAHPCFAASEHSATDLSPMSVPDDGRLCWRGSGETGSSAGLGAWPRPAESLLSGLWDDLLRGLHADKVRLRHRPLEWLTVTAKTVRDFHVPLDKSRLAFYVFDVITHEVCIRVLDPFALHADGIADGERLDHGSGLFFKLVC